MVRIAKYRFFQELITGSLFTCVVICLAFSSALPRNTLRAAENGVDYVQSYRQMDSLFTTVFDPKVSPGKGKGWKPFNRMRWFYGQRAYPFDDIPQTATMDAWQQKQATRNRSTLDESWSQIGPTNMAGRMLCLAWHPTNTSIIYAGAASGGLWKTTNGGSNWFSLTDDLPSLAVGSVALEPGNPNTIYIGTGEGSFNIDAVFGAGVFKSTDGGSTWNTTGLSWTQSQGRAINKIVIDPTNTQIVYAASNRSSGGGIYKSTNGGTSWSLYHTGDVKDLVIHPTNASVLYCAVGYPWGNAENGIFKSTDSGVTWTRFSTGLPSATSMGRMTLSISPTNPLVIYVGISQIISSGAGLYGIYKTTDGGSNWTLQATSPNMYSGQGWYNIVCAVDPSNPAIVYSSGLDCYKSTDSGVTWTRKSIWSYPSSHSSYAHADHHALAFMPGTPTTIIIGTDGGLSKSTNGGDTWSNLNNGLATYQFYAMGNDLLSPSVCYGGTQDCGTNKYSGSTSWTLVNGGDGGYCNVDFTNSNIVYSEIQQGTHYKSTNAGSSWSQIQSGISGAGGWVTPVAMDPTNANKLYTGTNIVYQTTNGGTLWTAISTALSGTDLSTIAVAPSSPSTIYVGYSSGGAVYKTTNTGVNWTSIGYSNAGFPNRCVTRIAVHPTDANILYVTVSGYGTGHVFKSTNGGTSWTNISTGLPDLPCNAFAIDPGNTSNLYVGNDLGVYASTDAGASWNDYSTGLPNVVVDDMAFHPTTGTLRVATHGRGMWETSTAAPALAVLTPNGSEQWILGSSQTISWSTGGLGGNVSIELNRSYPNGSWETLSASTANDGSQAWTVTGSATASARIRITSLSNPTSTDISNNNFSITQATLALTAPNGGETWPVGSSQSITWNLTGGTGSVVAQIDRNYPSGSWTSLTTTSGSSYSWTVTTPTSSTARIRVYLSSVPSICDTSSTNFSITNPSITITSPNGGESLTPGNSQVIRWTRQDLSGSVKVEINRTYSTGTWEVLSSSVSVDSLVWTVDQSSTTLARIRVTSVSYPTISDVSDANFTIRTPALSVSSPNGGESWLVGSTHTVRWSRANLTGPLNVYLNRTYSTGTWNLIAVNVTVDTLSWVVTDPLTSTARIRVTSVNIPSYYDESNANFTINNGDSVITVTAPVGGESWGSGTTQSITWTRNNAAGAASVLLNRNYPSGSWETLNSSITANNLSWTVTGPATTTARVKVVLNSNTHVCDTSTANFSIIAPALDLTYPTGGETWTAGNSVTIAWTRTNATGNVSVEVNRNYPSGTWENLTSTSTATSYVWTVTGPATANARVRVYLTSSVSVGDTSAANHSIIVPTITLSAPNGGETWTTGSIQTIRWSRSNAAGERGGLPESNLSYRHLGSSDEFHFIRQFRLDSQRNRIFQRTHARILSE